MSINVAYSINNENYKLAIVSILSLLKNNITNNFKIYLLHDDYFDNSLFSFFYFLEKYTNLESLSWQTVNYSHYKNISINVNFDNNLYCIELEKIINDDRVLFFAPATIVNDDISELYNMDLENYSNAAVEFITTTNNSQKKLYNKFSFRYNVILINLKEWRKKQYYEKFFSQEFYKKTKNDSKISMNLCLNMLIDDTMEISQKYNFNELEIPNLEGLHCSQNNKKEYKTYFLKTDTPSIINYTFKNPLYSNKTSKYNNLWWKYAEQTPFYDEIKQARELNKYKLVATSAKNSFKYSWLLSRIWPYIKP